MNNNDSTDNNKNHDRLLRVRSNLKRKKPTFKRIESWRYKRVPTRWRVPRGIDSKAKEKRKGWPKMPSIGYRGPKSTRYLSSSGKEEVTVFNVSDLQLINPTVQVGRIAATIGRKKREQIISEAEILDIHLVNPMFKKIDLKGLDEEIIESEDLSEEALRDLDLEDLDLDEDIGEEE